MSCNQGQRRNPNLELEVRRRSYEDQSEISGISMNRCLVNQLLLLIFNRFSANPILTFRLPREGGTPYGFLHITLVPYGIKF